MTKGTALETVTTGEDGKASYSVDLPISNGYYVSETQAPYAYIRNSKDVYSFNFNVLPETQAKASFSHTFVNDRTTAKVHIYKVDKESGKAAAQEMQALKVQFMVFMRETISCIRTEQQELYSKQEIL